MAVFTVHAPPQQIGDAAQALDYFAFVRDGFSFWAFLLAPFWMLWHRMWLVLMLYVAFSAGLETLVRVLGVSAFAVGLIGIVISLAIGLEAATLCRFTLSRRGWKNVGVVSGDDREAAERRFFDAWVSQPAGQHDAAATAVPSALNTAAPMPRIPQPPDIIGLFPEPGGQR